jgi:hypothetical protein
MLSHPSLLVFVVYLVNCSHFNPGCSVLLVITFFLGKSGCTCPGSNTNGPQGNMRSPGVDQLMAHTFLFALTVIQHTPPSSCWPAWYTPDRWCRLSLVVLGHRSPSSYVVAAASYPIKLLLCPLQKCDPLEIRTSDLLSPGPREYRIQSPQWVFGRDAKFTSSSTPWFPDPSEAMLTLLTHIDPLLCRAVFLRNLKGSTAGSLILFSLPFPACSSPFP